MFERSDNEKLFIKCAIFTYAIAGTIYLGILIASLSGAADGTSAGHLVRLGPLQLFEVKQISQSDGSSQLSLNFMSGTLIFSALVELVALVTFWISKRPAILKV